MELAIPLVALGGLYIVTNQKSSTPSFPSSSSSSSSSVKESFDNRLPNTNVPDANYPTPHDQRYPPLSSGDRLLAATSALSTVNHYDNGGVGAYTDKYFSAGMTSTEQGSNSSVLPANMGDVGNSSTGGSNYYYSLTGEKVGLDYFKHNNMTPAFGAKSRANLGDSRANESILDNYLGVGSQQMHKPDGQAPLFAPADTKTNVFGAPNMNDFFQTRYAAGTKMNGIKPFQPVQVGPGLGTGGDGVSGQGGYNSGLFERDLYKERSVDELRSAAKPKASEQMMYGHEGPAASRIKNMGIQAPVPRNRPERHFALGDDRMLPTLAMEVAPTMKAIPMLPDQHRADTSTAYTGVAMSAHRYAAMEGEYEPSKRQEYGDYELGVASASGRQFATEGDYGSQTTVMYPNNRSQMAAVEDKNTYFGGFGGTLGAVVAPLLEALRPTRKMNNVGNIRPYENAKSSVGGSYLFDTSEVLPPTIREQTMFSPQDFAQITSGQNSNGYLVTDVQNIPQNRETTNEEYYGNGKNRIMAPKLYDDAYAYEIKGLKSVTQEQPMAQGNMNIFNNYINYQGKPRELDTVNNRDWTPKMPTMLHSTSQMGEQLRKPMMSDEIDFGSRFTDTTLTQSLRQNPYALHRPYNLTSA